MLSPCHSERSEESASIEPEILSVAKNDRARAAQMADLGGSKSSSALGAICLPPRQDCSAPTAARRRRGYPDEFVKQHLQLSLR